MSLTITVTNAGRAAIVNAAKDGTNAVRIASVGVSATATTPSAATTALPGEIKRISTIAGDAVAADTIHVTVRDESSAVYAVRSIALYLADGTLFAAYGQADVLVEKSAQAMLLLALDVRFADIAATSLTFGATDFLNPPATTETAGVAELATDAETSAGTDDRRTVTPKGLSFALSARLSGWGSDIWRASNDGAGSGLDADLLDGQDGSYYANVTARLGYVPAARSGDTFTGNIIISPPSAAVLYLQPANNGHSGIVRLQRGTSPRWDFGMDTTPESGGNAGSAFYINRFDDAGNVIDTPFYILRATGEARAQGGRVWHSGNDGAGSGLDADLLDGRQASEFVSKAGDTMSGPLAVQGLEVTTGDIVMSRTSFAWGYIVRPNIAGYRKIQLAAVGGGPLENVELNAEVLTKQGSAIWHAANDGAGSGLDADLLDGQQGSYYANIPARLGYTPASRTGDTFTGNVGVTNGGIFYSEADSNSYGLMRFQRQNKARWDLGMDPTAETGGNAGSTFFINRFDDAGNVIDTPFYIIRATGEARVQGGRVWHSGNDGAGSGLDADLLDGHDGGYYADIIGRLGFWPVRQGTGIGQLSNVVQMGWSGTRVKVTIDASDMGNIVFDNHIADVWRVSNDGAGSGLDADLLDGRQASDFALLNDGSRFGANGNGYWERRPNGVIEQWGTAVGPFSEGQVFIPFPAAFTNADSINISATGVNNFGNNRFDITIQRVSRSTDGCTLMVQYTAASTSINQIDGIDWRAVGI